MQVPRVGECILSEESESGEKVIARVTRVMYDIRLTSIVLDVEVVPEAEWGAQGS
jgi:hypothetical protein